MHKTQICVLLYTCPNFEDQKIFQNCHAIAQCFLMSYSKMRKNFTYCKVRIRLYLFLFVSILLIIFYILNSVVFHPNSWMSLYTTLTTLLTNRSWRSVFKFFISLLLASSPSGFDLSKTLQVEAFPPACDIFAVTENLPLLNSEMKSTAPGDSLCTFSGCFSHW